MSLLTKIQYNSSIFSRDVYLALTPAPSESPGNLWVEAQAKQQQQQQLHVSFLCFLGYGMMTDGTTTFVNASACTVNFLPMNPPIVFDLPNPRTT